MKLYVSINGYKYDVIQLNVKIIAIFCVRKKCIHLYIVLSVYTEASVTALVVISSIVAFKQWHSGFNFKQAGVSPVN